MNDKVCIFVTAENLVAEEQLLRVSIMKAGDEKNSYEKQFYSPVNHPTLKAGVLSAFQNSIMKLAIPITSVFRRQLIIIRQVLFCGNMGTN